MKTRICCPVLLALLATWSLAAAQGNPQQPTQPGNAANAPAAGGPYDVVFLSQGRPVVVRLDIRVDGKSLQAAWDDFIDYVFKYADTDGDGVLNKEEADGAPEPSSLNSGAFLFGGFGGMGNPGGRATMDADKDGKVTRAEFADFYRRSGLPPFQIQLQTNSGPRMGMPFQQRTPTAADLNAALMKLLDKDRDGKLSRAELAAAPALFRKLDLDEDEVITHQELLPDFTPLNLAFGGVAYSTASQGPKQPDNNPVFLASSAGSSRDLARRLLARYGKGKKTLTRADISLGAAEFAQLDRDGNGELDAEELARFLPRTPELSVVVRLGERVVNEPAIEPAAGQARPPAGVTVRAAQDTMVLSFGKERLAVRVAPSKARAQLGVFIRQAAIAQFQAADRDNNGYLDEKEIQRSGFARITKQLDRDGDGKIYEKELIAYLEKVEELQARATSSCVSLHFADSGTGLFDLFDADRDGRLSLREIQAMPKMVDEVGKDGLISAAEIPHSYLFRVEQGAGGGGVDPYAIFETLGMNSGPRPALGRGPLWFQRMDRNRDGDVSRREFLGSDELFRRIDTDGDGLISLEEAIRYEASLKKGGQKR
jgi:Ca2+-binding EF-hand superfamily protein